MRTERITVIGGGRMGRGITQLMATEGCSVKLVSRHTSTLESALNDIRVNLTLLHKNNLIEGSIEDILGRIEPIQGIVDNIPIDHRIFDCDFLFEAIFEKPELKRALYAEIDPYISEGTIVGSSSSAINLKNYRGVVSRPDRMLITHWLNPAYIMPVVEVAVGEETSTETVKRTKDFLNSVGRLPVIMKDSPGFLLPRMFSALNSEALKLIEEGIASAEDVDTIIKGGLAFRLLVYGPLEIQDLGGLNVTVDVFQFLYSSLQREVFTLPAFYHEKVKKGEIGLKAGKGIYDYTGIDTRALFESRYQGFLELFDFIKSSETLSFEGGIKIRGQQTTEDS
jgi:3-hydroxybutyryl-CoA dehydrogenase